MKKTFVIVLVLLTIIIGTILVRSIISDQAPSIGSLQINSPVKAQVFINGQKVGETPYLSEKISPGEYKIKMESMGLSWEGVANVVPGGLTYILRELGPTPETSGGQSLSLEKLPGNKTELTVVSDPDGSIVTIDGVEKGKAPSVFKDLTPGEKVIIISSLGFSEQVVQANFIAGYRLNLVVKLRKLTLNPSSLPVIPAQNEVASVSAVIGQTSTGFLRVRQASSSSSLELGKVIPGQKFLVLEKGDGWIKIPWQNSSGWISSDFVIFQ